MDVTFRDHRWLGMDRGDHFMTGRKVIKTLISGLYRVTPVRSQSLNPQGSQWSGWESKATKLRVAVIGSRVRNASSP